MSQADRNTLEARFAQIEHQIEHLGLLIEGILQRLDNRKTPKATPLQPVAEGE